MADVVISAVPSATFDRIRADEIRDGAICVNVSEHPNFDDSILERASVFVPRVGPLTIAMCTRNLTRLLRLARDR
jgi:5,10-methylene-tetrahydrofolate dehydrogenase/methenyl tetrahydrofolate cyclohydrolase